MIGVITNALAIAILAVLGKLIGKHIPDRVQDQVLLVLPLSVMTMGIQMALKADDFFVVMMSVAIGSGIGAALDIDGALRRFGDRVDAKIRTRGMDDGGVGPMTAAIQSSILFCVGPMAIVGALEAGIGHNPETFFIKSALDGMTALMFASSMGIGVALSAIPTFIYQGALVLASSSLAPFINDVILADLTSIGGITILAIGFGILKIKEFRVSNMLPSFIVVFAIRVLMTLWM